MKDTANTPAPKYKVLVDDNFHFMDEDERYEQGSYDTLEEAIAESKKIVDDYLTTNYKPGMTGEELYAVYTGFGEDPFIVGPGAKFSAWKYAERRCAEICGGTGSDVKEKDGDIKHPVDQKAAGTSHNGIEDEAAANNRKLEEAYGLKRLGMLTEAEATLHTISETDRENYPEARSQLVGLSIAQHRCEDAATLGLATIAEKRHDIGVVVKTTIALTFVGRVEEARGVLAIVEDFGRPLAYHAYQMACFESLSGNFQEALRWLEIELRDPHDFEPRAIGDSDLFPLWNWLGTGALRLEDAHRLLAMPLEKPCAAALDPQGEILLDENDLKGIPECARGLFKFNFNKGMCELDFRAADANPEIAAQFVAERKHHIEKIVSMINRGRERALQVVLDEQPCYAARQAARGNLLAARWHTTWALSQRPGMIRDFYGASNGNEPLENLLDELVAAETIDPGFCHRMETVGQLMKADLDTAWKLLMETPPVLFQHPVNQLRWALLYHKDGDFLRALPIYLRLRDLWPEDPVSIANATDIFMKLGRWDEARSVFESAPPCYADFRLYSFQKDCLDKGNREAKRPSVRTFRGEPDLAGVLLPDPKKEEVSHD